MSFLFAASTKEIWLSFLAFVSEKCWWWHLWRVFTAIFNVMLRVHHWFQRLRKSQRFMIGTKNFNRYIVFSRKAVKHNSWQEIFRYFTVDIRQILMNSTCSLKIFRNTFWVWLLETGERCRQFSFSGVLFVLKELGQVVSYLFGSLQRLYGAIEGIIDGSDD